MNAGIPAFAIAGDAAPAGLPAATARCLERFVAWGAAPTVDGYCALFAPDGTLLDADMEAPIGGVAIRESIGRVLQLLPDFRFTPVRVVAEGSHAFVHAANRATLGDRALAWDAVYALTLAGDRIAAGRRYYDQAALALGTETFAQPTGAATVACSAWPVAVAPDAIDLEARGAAWRRSDAAALAAPFGHVRLHMAGVQRALDDAGEVRAALATFLARSGGLRLAPGAVVRTPDAHAIEWVGTVGDGPPRRRFALVELCLFLPQRREWHLVFNTLGF